MKKRALFLLKISAAALMLICFLLYPARYTRLVLDGATLWAVSVLPATLPFLFLTGLLLRENAFLSAATKLARPAGRVFRISGAGGLSALISALSGYPVGARTVLDLRTRGCLSKEELLRTAALSSTSGPMFLVGAVGAGMFRSPRVGWLLLLAHLAGVALVGFFLGLGKKRPSAPALLPPVTRQEKNLMAESVLSVLTVGGSVSVFYAFAGIACDLLALAGLDGGILCALVTGLIEMTSGCSLLMGAPSALSYALAAFFVTFGGGCVLVQQTGFLAQAGVKPVPFCLIKLFQGVCAFLFMLLLSLLLGL